MKLKEQEKLERKSASENQQEASKQIEEELRQALDKGKSDDNEEMKHYATEQQKIALEGRYLAS